MDSDSHFLACYNSESILAEWIVNFLVIISSLEFDSNIFDIGKFNFESVLQIHWLLNYSKKLHSIFHLKYFLQHFFAVSSLPKHFWWYSSNFWHLTHSNFNTSFVNVLSVLHKSYFLRLSLFMSFYKHLKNTFSRQHENVLKNCIVEKTSLNKI